MEKFCTFVFHFVDALCLYYVLFFYVTFFVSFIVIQIKTQCWPLYPNFWHCYLLCMFVLFIFVCLFCMVESEWPVEVFLLFQLGTMIGNEYWINKCGFNKKWTKVTPHQRNAIKYRYRQQSGCMVCSFKINFS